MASCARGGCIIRQSGGADLHAKERAKRCRKERQWLQNIAPCLDFGDSPLSIQFLVFASVASFPLSLCVNLSCYIIICHMFVVRAC